MLNSCRRQPSAEIKFQVNLENAPFDSLFIYYYGDSSRVTFSGKEIKKHVWIFSLPEKLLESSVFLRLTNQFYDQQNDRADIIRFYGESKGNRNYFDHDGFILEDKIIHHNLHAKYNNKELLNDKFVVDFDANNKLNVITNHVLSFNFEVLNKDDDIYVMSQLPFFSQFTDPNDSTETYDDFMNEYIMLSKKYPDSKYLMYSLSDNILS